VKEFTIYGLRIFLACFLTAIVASGATPVPVTALAFSPDGSVLVSNGPRRVDIRSAKDAAVLDQLSCDLAKITSIAFQPNSGGILAVAGGEPGLRGETQLFDWNKRTIVRRFTNAQDLATSVAFNGDGTLLGIASGDHQARVWRLARNEFTNVFTLSGHAGPVLAIAFSPTARTVVTASADRSIKVWSVDDGRLLRTFAYHLEAVNALAFRPVSNNRAGETPPCFCASGSDDRTVRVWQPEIGRMVRIIRQHKGSVFAVAFTQDGKNLFSAGKEGVIRCFDADSDALLSQWTAHSDWIYALAASPDGTKLASGDWSGKVNLHEIPVTQ
jgi:WD40 repeat protein